MENLLMKKDIQKCLEIYKEQLNQGYIFDFDSICWTIKIKIS